MEKTKLGKYTKGFGLSFGITSVFSAILVILKETHEETILAAMKSLGHHWVTHGLINIILFVVLGWLLSKANKGQGVNLSANSLVSSIIGAIVVSSILISGFFLIH